MTSGNLAGVSMLSTASAKRKLGPLLFTRTYIGTFLGPLIGVLIWTLPLGVEPAAHTAFAISALILVYWIMEPVTHAITALLGCFLFWALQVTSFSVAFSGFTQTTPWFIFGALLIGQATLRTGLAKRLGFLVMLRVGTSYMRLLFGILAILLLLQFLVPASNGQVVVLAPVVIGLITAFEVGPRSNIATGFFVMLVYATVLFGKMFLNSAPTILARGIIEQQAGLQVLWSQWLIACLPLTLLTLMACWLIGRWLYPPEMSMLPGGSQYLQEALRALGPWSKDERKATIWLGLAIVLWATDFLHHKDPALIGIGIGLLMTLPGIGVLDTTAVQSVNFSLILFLGGALSMSNVLISTHALSILTDGLEHWLAPFLSHPFSAAFTLYWGGFLYHFLMPSESPMISTALPMLLNVAAVHGYNPIAVGLLWTLTSGSCLFLYESSILLLGYSYGYFGARDLLKVGAILTVVEGLFILLLVPLYWPLIGLPWRATPQVTAAVTSAVAAAPVVTTDALQWKKDLLLPVAAAPVVTPRPSGLYVPSAAALHTPGVSGVHLPLTWAQIERQPNQFDWRSLEQHPTFVSAVRAGKQVGLQVELQGVAGKPAVPAWAQVPQLDVATGSGPRRRWPVVWSPQFQTAFARFVAALGQRYDGDPRLAYVVMTEGTAIPYARHPQPWDAAGYSPAGYSTAYQQLYQMYQHAFTRTPLVAAISHLGQESQAVLQSSPEGQALQELLTFAGQQGLHFLVPEVYTRLTAQSIYVRDALLRPVLQQYASRSQLLVKLDPGELQGEPLGAQTLQMVQERWPEIPVWVVIPTR